MRTWRQLSRAPQSRIAQLQLGLIRHASRYLWPFQPFLQRHSATQRYFSIRSWEEFRRLPFTSKLDLLPTDDNPKKPRDFILQPNQELIRKHWSKRKLIALALKKLMRQDVVSSLEREFKPIHIHFTTGRSTSQIPFLYTFHDIETLRLTGQRIFETIGATKDDIVVNAFPFAPHLAFWLAYNTTINSNVLTLHTGGGKLLGTEKIMNAVESLQATVLIIMPGYGYHLLREAVEQKRDFSSLRIVVFGGERVSPGLRRKIKGLLARLGAKNVRVLATYALTEAKTAWVQCHEESGYHLYPDLELIELVDRDGNVVEEGKPGEIVYTSLGWRGSVVTRYRTGDHCKSLVVSAPCKYCGRTVPQLHQSIERRSDMMELHLTKVKGELVNLNTLHAIMHEIPAVEEWQTEVKKKNNDPYEVDELVVTVAFKDKKNHDADVAQLQQLIKRDMALSAIVEVQPLHEVVQRLGLETELKERRIIDRRKESQK